MPLSTGHKNKMKAWRREARVANAMAGKRIGRMLKYQSVNLSNRGAAASSLLIDLLQRAEVPLRSVDNFKKYMSGLENQRLFLESQAVSAETVEQKSE